LDSQYQKKTKMLGKNSNILTVEGGDEIDVVWVEDFDHTKEIKRETFKMNKKNQINIKKICDGKNLK
jgi:hypothetical protein